MTGGSPSRTLRPAWLDAGPWRAMADLVDEAAVARALQTETPGPADLAALLSPMAARMLEPMARRAEALTRAHFGRTIQLYAPLYLSDHCSGGCVYCGFAANRRRPRHRLDGDSLRAEMDALEEQGLEEVLLLTGERSPHADYPYVRECVAAAAKRFHGVMVESFPMTLEEYRGLAAAGCDGVTLYQETYDPAVYARMHRWGPKRDYAARLAAPSRVLAAGLRTVGLGALLGLADPVSEAIGLYLHAVHLRKTFWRGGISLSFPRIRPQTGGFVPPAPVDESRLAQIVFAFRLCLPDVPLVLSTRERPGFRDGIAGLGITKMSAGSRTGVGGYRTRTDDGAGQFEISDDRDVASVCAGLRGRRLEPVFKNWDAVYR